MLDRIVATKRQELVALVPDMPVLRERAESAAAAPGFEASLRAARGVAVIAEVKRRSPSAGEIRQDAAAADVARTYAASGAAAISVLTDREYFGGALADLEDVAATVRVPVLRKDFTIHAVQVYEARAAGAAAVLLIVRILDDAQLRDLHQLATGLGLGVLVEVHDEPELDRALAAGARVVGVNNRDLSSFAVDLAITERLAPRVPAGCVLVGESGIREVSAVERLAAAGVDAVLVGEALMRSPDAAATVGLFGAVPRTGRSGRDPS